MNAKTFKLLEEADWGTISRKLLAYTIKKARNLRWRGILGISERADELIAGVSCEDVVQLVIIKTIEGIRKWDPDKGELEPWLIQQVNSEISHLVESRLHKNEVTDISESVENSEIVSTATSSPSSGFFPIDPAKIVLKQQEIEEKLSIIYEAADGDPELDAVIMSVLDGCDPKPRYLSAELGVPIKDINNRIRKLARRVMKDGQDNEK